MSAACAPTAPGNAAAEPTETALIPDTTPSMQNTHRDISVRRGTGGPLHRLCIYLLPPVIKFTLLLIWERPGKSNQKRTRLRGPLHLGRSLRLTDQADDR